MTFPQFCKHKFFNMHRYQVGVVPAGKIGNSVTMKEDSMKYPQLLQNVILIVIVRSNIVIFVNHRTGGNQYVPHQPHSAQVKSVLLSFLEMSISKSYF